MEIDGYKKRRPCGEYVEKGVGKKGGKRTVPGAPHLQCLGHRTCSAYGTDHIGMSASGPCSYKSCMLDDVSHTAFRVIRSSGISHLSSLVVFI